MYHTVDGESVRVCAQFDIKLKQRSVSFGGFDEKSIVGMLKALGYDNNDEAQRRKAEHIAATLAGGTSTTYRFSVFHFPADFLHWTASQVRWSKGARKISIWPSIPAELVHFRTQLFLAAIARGESASTESFARAELPTHRRPHPDERRLRVGMRDLELVGGMLGKRDTQRTPPSAQPLEKAGRRAEPDPVAGSRHSAAVMRLKDSLEAAHAEVQHSIAARAGAEQQLAAEAAQRSRDAAEREAEHEAELAAAYAARDDLARRLAEREQELADMERMLAAERVAHASLAAAAAKSSKFVRWSTEMLAPGGALSKICRQLTSFASLETFRLWFDTVCDKQGWENPELAGMASRLDYFYNPKHAPRVPIGQAEPARLDAAAAVEAALAAARTRWSQQLNPEKPGGLASPFEACFMTLAMTRLGLTVAEVAALFNLGTGTVSQIYRTWLVFLHESMKAWAPWPGRDLVRANLPKKFTTHLAQVTHSNDCHCIFDCTEVSAHAPPTRERVSRVVDVCACLIALPVQIEVDIPEDEGLRKLFYSSYKKRHTIKFLVAITPCGTIAFISDGYPGSYSDDEIVRASGFLDLLEPGMAVMSDRGYDNFASLRERGVELIIPSLSHTIGKGAGRERAPFTDAECQRTYRIANLRIHVERVRTARNMAHSASALSVCAVRTLCRLISSWNTTLSRAPVSHTCITTDDALDQGPVAHVSLVHPRSPHP